MVAAHYIDDGPEGACPGGACDAACWDMVLLFACEADLETWLRDRLPGLGRRNGRIVQRWESEAVLDVR